MRRQPVSWERPCGILPGIWALAIWPALLKAAAVRWSELAGLLLEEPIESKTDGRRAAVALILREHEEEVEVLLMRRVTREGDPWSGQVSLPGGMESSQDSDLWATAIRETEEEVGCRLAEIGERLGAVSSRPAVARGKVQPTEIYPLVFRVEQRPELRLGPEAERAFWLPLGQAAKGILDKPYAYNETVTFPSWHWDDETVWGLTYGILLSLLALVQSPE